MSAAHVDDLIDLEALGALDAEESIFVRAHVTDCPRCRAILDEAESVAARLAFSVPLHRAPASMRAGVMAEVAARPVTPTPERAQRSPFASTAIMRLSRRSFVSELDFVTSPGHLGGAGERDALGLPGSGPQLVVTDKCVFRFDEATKEMTLASLHPGVAPADVQAEVGWELGVAPDVAETQPPTDEELRLLRDVLDPQGIYTG